MSMSDKIAFYVSMFGMGLSTGLLISFSAWSVKKVIQAFEIMTETEKGGIEL